jgi:hypothetical protein
MTTITTKDAFSPMLHLLAFIYANKILSTEEAELLQDIELASRFQLPQMQARCEDLLLVSEPNALRLLLLADKLKSKALEERAIHFIVMHLPALSQTKSFLRVQRDRPDIVDQILSRARQMNSFRSIISEKGVRDAAGLDEDDPVVTLNLLLRSEEQQERERLEKENQELFARDRIHWPLVAISVLSILSYGYVITRPDLLPLVPYINGIASLVAIATLLNMLRN